MKMIGIFISVFYEEEKLSFKPSLEHLITLQRVEKAVEDFNNLEKVGLIPIQDVIHWHNKMKNLADDLKLNNPFVRIKYKAFKHIDFLYRKVSHLANNYKENHLAKSALDTYHKIHTENEENIVKWLIENKKKYFYSLKKTENWEKTGVLILETEPNLVVDCSDYLDGYLFNELYYSHHNDIMKKYEPTKEHLEQNKEGIKYSLESHLRIHNMYLDLL